MIVYVPIWLEFSYLELFSSKVIYYNNYEQNIFEEDNEFIFIKNLKNYDIYKDNKKIIVIINTHANKDYIQVITIEEITKKICDKFNYKYDKKIVNYCEKNEICPFITILNLSLGGQLPIKEKKPLLISNNTIGTSKYLQVSLTYFALNKKYHNLFKDFSYDKCLYLHNNFIELEKDFAYTDEDLGHIFLLPIFLKYI